MSSQVSNPMIELKDVSKIYNVKSAPDGQVKALDNVSLTVERGSIHGIVGQSGAGKSTLIRCLSALEKPTSGSVVLDGEEITLLSGPKLRQVRRKIGMVFQSANLLDSRTAAGNIAYPLYLTGVERGKRHQRVAELLELVGLTERASAYPSQLSGGQRQRVGIARALAVCPQILLCDEPTSALDQETTKQVLHLLYDLRKRLGVTVIIITHEMAVVREICDSITLIEKGRICQSGKVEDILKDPTSTLSMDLIPLPKVEQPPILEGEETRLIDVAFTSEPGKPTGSAVLSLAASVGADVAGGLFETVGKTQVGRIVLAVPPRQVDYVVATLRSKQLHAEARV